MEKEAILEVHGVGKTFLTGGREIPALDDIVFSVRPGEFICIVGPTGCGKSTLLKIMAGLEAPTKGSVTCKGTPLVGGTQPSIMSMVFQEYALFPWRSVMDNVALPLELRNVPLEERRKSTTKYIDMVGLDGFEDKYIKDLSAGMRRRVEVARCLVTEPEIIFMDEPFGSLDAYTSSILRRDLVKIIEELKEGTTVIMTTKNLTEAVELGDRILMLSSKPARVKGEMKIDMERPRSETSKAFMNYYKKAFTLFEKHKAAEMEGEETA